MYYREYITLTAAAEKWRWKKTAAAGGKLHTKFQAVNLSCYKDNINGYTSQVEIVYFLQLICLYLN